MSDDTNPNSVELATELTIAWLKNPNNRITAEEVPTFLRTMHATLADLASGAPTSATEDAAKTEEFVPAVSVRPPPGREAAANRQGSVHRDQVLQLEKKHAAIDRYAPSTAAAWRVPSGGR